MRRVLPLLLPLLLLSGQTVTFVNGEVTTDGTTVVTDPDGGRTTYNSTGNDTITTSATSETDGWTQSGLDVENTTTTAVDLNATTTTAETSTSPTPSTTTRRTTRTTTTTTTTTTTPPPPNWNLLPVERCLCRLDRSLSWAREQLIAEILLAEEAARAAATTTLSPNETQTVTGDPLVANNTDVLETANDNSTAVTDLGLSDESDNVTSVTLGGNAGGNTDAADATTEISTDGQLSTTTETVPDELRRRKREVETTTGISSTTEASGEATFTELCLNGTCQNITNITEDSTVSLNSTEADISNTTTAQTTVTETSTTSTTTTTTTTTRVTTTTPAERQFPPGVMASGHPRRRRLSLCHCPEKVAGVWGSIRILNMHWRTVLLYPEEVAYQEATKYIHEQLDRIFRQTLGSWYSTSEVLNMEEGSVIAHHKVYLTREVENMTELVQASFEAGYESGVSDIRVDNSTSYYIPPGPVPKPAIWYLRYLALAIGIVIMIAIMYDIAWRTNTCALRSPYGYLEEPDGKQHVTLRERLRVAADKTREAAGRTLVATRDVAVKTGRTISNPETFRKIGTLVTTNVVWVKTVGALKKSPPEDRQPTLDPEQGLEQQAEQLEQQLDEPGQTDGADVQEPGEGESPAEGEGEGEATDKDEGEAPADASEEATPSDESDGGSPEAEEGAPKEEEQEPAESTENEQPSEDAPTEPAQQEADS
ncbi:uncharacterized protein LOC122374506 [Amphibalanus amphitrite]|uniref:uncharacterized protein LOC122374506 n=1 Tax=Amphibalanus amphitrite TaxID=1232801 RepID=UPI001C924667|nr:uncharacterized protein LOC122374506 [Amphibalanus amphitrite]